MECMFRGEKETGRKDTEKSPHHGEEEEDTICGLLGGSWSWENTVYRHLRSIICKWEWQEHSAQRAVLEIKHNVRLEIIK